MNSIKDSKTIINYLFSRRSHYVKTFQTWVMLSWPERHRRRDSSGCFSNWPPKDSRQNGMHTIFYQKCWQVVDKKFLVWLMHFFILVIFSKIWIEPIFLCSLKRKTKKESDFRPVSLCNIIYKFIAKLLAKRLIMVFPKTISPLQSCVCS